MALPRDNMHAWVADDYAHRADRLLAAFIGAIGEAVIGIAGDRRIIVFNHAAETLFGYAAAEVLDTPLQSLLAFTPSTARTDAGDVQEGDAVASLVHRDAEIVEGVRRDGSRFAAAVSAAVVGDSDEPLAVAIVRDVSTDLAAHNDLVQALHDQRQRAETDALTGLGNRRALEEALAREQARLRRGGEPFSLIYIDLDGFKAVNDRHGHAFGDRLLRDIAAHLRAFFREMDFIARLGGDEFAILTPNSQAQAIAERIEFLRRRIGSKMRDRGLAVTLSAGILHCRAPCADTGYALHAADTLMYRAKRSRDAVAVGVVEPSGITDLEGRALPDLDDPALAG